MRQGIAVLVMACMIAVMMPAQMLTAFAANAKITFSDPSATVGSQVKVNMKITSSSNLANADVMLAYDSSALEFVSGTNADGGAGAVRVHGDGGTPGTGTLAFTLQFNALTAGTSKITVTSQEIYDSGDQLVTVEHEGSSTVTVGALQTASKDATLKSLKVSPGELTPAFSPDVDTYAVTVGTDVDKLIISAETTDANAQNVVVGNDELQMGENRVTCKVTAQDGETTKEYVIVVTKAEGGASAASGDASAAEVKMEISKRVITILQPDASVEVPIGFKPTTINIDGHKVQGWVWGASEKPEYCVVYGMNETGEKNFYRYDMKDSERTIQRYFADPAASDTVSTDVFNNLADQYDSIRDDFNLFKILLAVTVAIALVLLIILLVVVMNKKGKDGGPGGDGTPGSRGSRAKAAAKKKNQIPSEDSEGYQDYEEDGYGEEDSYGEEDGYGEDDGYGDTYDDQDDAGDYEDDPAYDDSRASKYQMGYEEEYGDDEGYDDTDDSLEEDRYGDAAGHRETGRYEGAARLTDRPSQPLRPVEPPKAVQHPKAVQPPKSAAPPRPSRPSGPAQPARPVKAQDDGNDDFEIFDL